MKKVFALLLILVLSLVTLVGCSGTSQTSNTTTANSGTSQTIKIGMVNPLSGNSATYGQSHLNGMKLAADEINANGGINGAKIEIVTYDDAGNPQQAASGAQKFADEKDIMAIVGSCLSSPTLAMVPITDKAKIPQLVVSSSSPKLDGISPYFFRMAVQDSQVGKLIGELAADKLKAQKAVIMYPNDDYGKGLSASVAATLKEKNVNILDSISYLDTDQDFSAALTKIKNEKPDVIALCGTYTDSGLIVKQARQNGITAQFIGGTGPYSPKYMEIGGPATEGTIFLGVFIASNPDPKVQDFVKKYKAKYGTEPDTFAALAYDQMYVIAQAAKTAMNNNGGKLTRETLTQSLKGIDYKGITGEVKFNDKGDWVRPYLYITIKDGKFALYNN